MKATLCEYFEFSCWLRFAVLFQFYFDFIRDHNRKDNRSRLFENFCREKKSLKFHQVANKKFLQFKKNSSKKDLEK